MCILAKLNERIKELRIFNQMTQKQVAEHLNVQSVTVQRFEYGERRPSLENLIILADYFNVSLDYLVGRSDERERR